MAISYWGTLDGEPFLNTPILLPGESMSVGGRARFISPSQDAFLLELWYSPLTASDRVFVASNAEDENTAAWHFVRTTLKEVRPIPPLADDPLPAGARPCCPHARFIREDTTLAGVAWEETLPVAVVPPVFTVADAQARAQFQPKVPVYVPEQAAWWLDRSLWERDGGALLSVTRAAIVEEALDPIIWNLWRGEPVWGRVWIKKREAADEVAAAFLRAGLVTRLGRQDPRGFRVEVEIRADALFDFIDVLHAFHASIDGTTFVDAAH
jgi:hypothetical protein